ncbi:MAG: hypothetical protein ABFS32_21290, partial [Bacteroidota bacterium]
LSNVAQLIKETVDPSGKPWGPVRYRLAYGNEQTQAAYENSQEIKYLKPKKKKKPYIEVN